MRSRTAPVTEVSDFATEISVLGMKSFQYEHSSPSETFLDIVPGMCFHCRGSSKGETIYKAVQ